MDGLERFDIDMNLNYSGLDSITPSVNQVQKEKANSGEFLQTKEVSNFKSDYYFLKNESTFLQQFLGGKFHFFYPSTFEQKINCIHLA